MSTKPPTPERPSSPTARWVSQSAAAAHAGISGRTLTGLINTGELPAYRLGKKLVRVDLNDVDALMKPLNGSADRLPIRPTVRQFRDGTTRQSAN